MTNDHIIVPVIQDLSHCKYVYNWCVAASLDIHLARRGVQVDDKERNRLLKKLTRTLHQLGYGRYMQEDQPLKNLGVRALKREEDPWLRY